MTQDKNIGVERFEVAGRVLQRFAFGQTRCRRRNIDHVGTQPVGGQLEGRARPGARLDEKVDQGFATQRRNLFDLPRPDLFERGGRF